MSDLSRASLKLKFKNGCLPTQNDFADLIESCLNKRDDRFFGCWEAGVEYCHGDVVLSDKGLYMLQMVESETTKDCENDTHEQKKEKHLCLCSNEPPHLDTKNWCPLKVEAEDDDWEIVQNDKDKECIMYAKVFGKIGIGTKDPCARLDIQDSDKDGENAIGQYVWAPECETTPTFGMKNKKDAASNLFVKQSLKEEKVEILANTPLGYLFKKVKLSDCENVDWPKSPVDEALESCLVFITVTGKEEKPAVGIGTGSETPAGALDVKEEAVRQVVLNPTDSSAPQILLIKVQEPHRNLSISVEEYAVFDTDAAAFQFNFGNPQSDKEGQKSKEKIEPKMVIQKDGNVGIGINDPKAKLHVYENDCGYFTLNLEDINPCLGIVNYAYKNREQTEVSMGIGTSDTHAVLITNAPEGFVLKNGENTGQKSPDKDIAQGINLVEISQEGKVGIKTHPENFLLEVNGPVSSYETFQQAPEGDDLAKCVNMGPVLTDVCDLKPIIYAWEKNSVPCDDGSDKLGIDVEDCYHLFPRAIKKIGGKSSISYTGLVAVCVKAIQELNDKLIQYETKIAKNEQRICDLEAQLNKED